MQRAQVYQYMKFDPIPDHPSEQATLDPVQIKYESTTNLTIAQANGPEE